VSEPPSTNAATRTAPSLTWRRRLAFAAPQASVALTTSLLVPWLTYFYVPPSGSAGGRAALVSGWLFAAYMFGGRALDAVLDPLVGHWSDRSRSPYGRRRPFIVLGTPVFMGSFALLWFPPFPSGSTGNAVFLGVVMTVFFAAFTVVLGPYSALLPEIAPSNRERVQLTTWMGVAMLIGSVAGALLTGPLQSAYPDGLTVAGVRFESSLQAVALLGAVSMVLLFPPAFVFREAPPGSLPVPPGGLWQSLKSIFGNPAFLTFMGIAGLAQLGLAMLLTALPYVGKQILEQPKGVSGWVSEGQGEAWTGYLMGILVLGTVVSLPVVNKLATRVSKKRLMVVAGWMLAGVSAGFGTLPFFPEPAPVALIIMTVMSFPAAVALIVISPLVADIIDDDAKRTGFRREGIYTGGTSILNKAALGLGNGLVVLLLGLDQSPHQPWGLLLVPPLAALAIAAGTMVFARHSIDA
jgi:glycoside/pentoside/hexuronide:cation symporter, GPH family